MARRPRHLSAEDKEIWQKVAQSTTRLTPSDLQVDGPFENHDFHVSAEAKAAGRIVAPTSSPKSRTKAQVKAQAQFRLGEKAHGSLVSHNLAPKLDHSIASQPVSMDRKTFGKMKKGRLSPQARIDLHGLTIAQAHPVLIRFIMEAVATDLRLVLVITGKGKNRDDGGPIPVRHGVLRHQVPHWLNTMPLRPHILQISQAHLKHGGQGAYYVYLRRQK
jgi:DNA-nicking Smr family endonuclease